ncbi:uncharacterized protein PFB0145c isoform X2 [Eurytemora carolleeae]|uniref:uncharacterized protein PFB0145c isoform X2 n=1 Tax=Eurytemora carolleeae TaxID=1294199 RepID=UPI000C76DA8F|nr:uncharacterized protein PFB0145c isoform X2 [Eurytemora carolleeae]|eukprot:XP_023321329.1 uncharacterized protein PFB0145c-like isoform X2 [Eurytemora affinis]
MSGYEIESLLRKPSFRDTRSPSKCYEDSIIMEKKIREIGLFSENVGFTFMSLLSDEQEMKNIIKVGFKEVEREMQELDEALKEETKIRAQDDKDIKSLLESQVGWIKDAQDQLEKRLESRVQDLEAKCTAKMDDVGGKIEKMVERILQERMKEMKTKFDGLEEKIMENMIGTDRRMVNLERKTQEETRNALKAVEQNNKVALETLAQRSEDDLALIKQAAENKESEFDALKASILETQENETKRLKEEGDKIMKTISKGQEDMKTFQTQVDNKINVLSNELGDIKNHIEDKTGEIDASIEAMHVSFKDRFEAERTETARETEAMKKQFKDDLEEEKRAREQGFKQEGKSRQDLSLRIDGLGEQLEEKINKVKQEEKESRDQLALDVNTLKEETKANLREIDEGLNVRADELKNDFERKKQEIISTQHQVEHEINKNMEKIKTDLDMEMELQKEENKENLNKSSQRVDELEENISSQISSKLLNQQQLIEKLENKLEAATNCNQVLREKEENMELALADIRQEQSLPLSVAFNAVRDVDYILGGEEYLTFSHCTVNSGAAMDPKSGVFTVPYSGIYFLSLREIGSLYDQNHLDNHKSSMCSQIVLVSAIAGDLIQVYMYTGSGITDKSSNHFTQFSGLLLRTV